jgi:tRNA threonylcarbamoyladenosine biosynthesis protein TsaE
VTAANPLTGPFGEWPSTSAEDTLAIGARAARNLAGGEIILLSGPLGAGKTVFAKGVANGLEIDPDEVTSPSFTLVNVYRGKLTVYHLDLYRLEAGVPAAQVVGLEDLLSDEQAVILVEWAERLGRYPLPSPVWQVAISGDGEGPRRVVITRRESRTA